MPETIHELRPPARGLPRAKVLVKPPVARLQHFWQRGRFYEEDVLRYVYRNYSGGIFVDCGSSIGNHTLFFAMYCKPYFVVSVEPVKASLDHQWHNLALNGLRNVHCFNVAVNDRAGTGRMVKAEENPGARWPWNEGMWELELGKGKVEVTTLDLLLKDIAGVTLIKLDIEGYELKALQGARELLAREKPVLLIEAYPERRRRKFARFLVEFGYGRGKRVYKNMFEFKAKLK
jgi:protein O-GlcNAc transferase